MASNTPAKVVATFFEALSQGDVATARDCWTDNAIWHATGRADLAGDYEPEAYFAMLGEWAARYPEYDFTSTEVGEFNDTAVFFIESRNGMAPGRASGLTVYRVTAGRIAEGWAIPAFGDGRYLF